MRGVPYPPDTACLHCGFVPSMRQRNRLRQGRCVACYVAWLRSGQTQERIIPPSACRLCGGPHWAKGLCRYHHYWQTPGVRERHQARTLAYSRRRRAERRAS